ncbi:hypothetical protein [Nocardia farcinica]|uniref:hypothetical protein n=1 Tax=Nocardia farcinica TaxID=37329 RepID=UPI0018960449|nr:hypothetical protein [Nocardia farcinica]MBF6231365.1 hypothetical protein [Nocardia farcinica]MBF6269320.1 hypothetical protein [Nocardia farcinica]MBF6381635.1 hypothetical protein [Nocardia farcinica]
MAGVVVAGVSVAGVSAGGPSVGGVIVSLPTGAAAAVLVAAGRRRHPLCAAGAALFSHAEVVPSVSRRSRSNAGPIEYSRDQLSSA